MLAVFYWHGLLKQNPSGDGDVCPTIPMLLECLYGGVYEYLTLGWLVLCFGSQQKLAENNSFGWLWGLGAGCFSMSSI